jgi:hypothetical protein
MPEIFSGKVAIPADQLDAHFRALAEAEEARRPFRRQLTGLKAEFERHLATHYTPKTARKHALIVEAFIDFLCDYTDVATIEAVTRGMANSGFKRWYKGKVWDSTTTDDLRVALKKFFQFLDKQKGLRNQKVLDSFR